MEQEIGIYCDIIEENRIESGNGHWSYPLLGPSNGCVNECMSGVSYYSATEFTPPASHTFQEGFLVLSGTGEAKVGAQIVPLKPMRSFLVPAGTEHGLRSASSTEPLILFWFHAKG